MDNINTPIDDQFLAAMGLDGLEGEEKQNVLADILYTLNIRVGQRVAELLTPEQAEQFSTMSENAPEEEISAWLQKNVPNGDQIIEQEAQNMKQEAQSAVDKVMGRREIAEN